MKTPPFAVPAGIPPEKTYEALRAEVAARLKNVCAEWSLEDFNEVVDKVTRTAMRYAKPAALSSVPLPLSGEQRGESADYSRDV